MNRCIFVLIADSLEKVKVSCTGMKIRETESVLFWDFEIKEIETREYLNREEDEEMGKAVP